MKKMTILAACFTALALSACSSTGGGSDTPASAKTSNRPLSNSGACKQINDYGGKGKNIVYRCNIAAVLKTSDAQAALDNIPVSYGSNGKWRTNATARSFGRDEAASCERAVLNGILSLQNRVKKQGGSRLTNVVSYRAGSNGHFDRHSFLPAGQADCIVATFQSRVVLRGSVN